MRITKVELSNAVPSVVHQMASMYSQIGVKVEEVQVAFIKSQFNTAKACFWNAQHLVQSLPGSSYVLGFVMTCGIPVEHAWVKLQNGVHVDPTLVNPIPHYACLEIPRDEIKMYAKAAGDGYIELASVNRYLRRREK